MRIQPRHWESIPLHVTTPMFVGRDTKTRAEFRVSSLRGVLRYWFRFLAAPVVGHDLGKLRAAESAIFGNTESSSAVAMRITKPVTHALERSPEWLPKKGWQIDVRYLLGQGLQEYHGDSRENRLTKAFLPRGTDVPLEIWFGGFRDVLLPVLWYAQTFGGVGARTRRGWGGFRLDVDWPWSDTIESRGTVAETFDAAFRSVSVLARLEEKTEREGYPAFPSSADWSVFLLGDASSGTKAWLNTLNIGAEWIREARATVDRGKDYVTPEYLDVAWPYWKNNLAGGSSFNLGGFGLPIVLRSRKASRSARVEPSLSETGLRRASMVSFRAFVTESGACTPMLILTRCDLLPDGAKLAIAEEDRDAVILSWSTEAAINRILGS